MAENLEEMKMSADGYSSVPVPVTPEGGESKKKLADVNKEVDADAETVADGVTKKTNKPEVAVESVEGLNGLFEGLDLSEEFKSKVSVVFEAAVNEAAEEKANALIEEIESDLQEQFQATLAESLDEIVENLDTYLDYIAQEWMKENEIAVESGIKVQMAESLMGGLKELFYEHNVEIDENTIDVVADLEEELKEMKSLVNRTINERIEIEEAMGSLYAEHAFNMMTEGLSDAQIERFRVLSEKINCSDLESYTNDLKTIKESFFNKKQSVIVEDLSQEGDEILIEETDKSTASNFETVNAYTNFLNNLK